MLASLSMPGPAPPTGLPDPGAPHPATAVAGGGTDGRRLPPGLEGLLYLALVTVSFRSIPTHLEASFPALAPLAARAALFTYEGARQTIRVDPILGGLSSLLVLCALAYFVVDLAAAKGLRSPSIERAKGILVASAVVALLWVPTLHQAILRRNGGDPARFAHDGGVIATEIAGRMLREGKNPYAESFRGTELERHVYGATNPIMEHYPYPPGNFVAAAVLEPPTHTLLGWYDQRLVTLAASLLLVGILVRAGPGDARSRLLALAVLVNPISLNWTIEGNNDLPFLALVVGAAILVGKGRVRSGLLVLGLAATLKQFAWLYAPYFLLVARDAGALRGAERRGRPPLFWLALPPAIVVVPFLLWNPVAFLQDTLLYHAGQVAHPYPMGGTPGRGIANWILILGLVKENTARFPFAIVHLAISLPIAALAYSRLARGPRAAGRLLLACGVTTLAVTFSSRSLQENYLGVVTSLLAAGVLLEPGHPSSSRGVPTTP